MRLSKGSFIFPSIVNTHCHLRDGVVVRDAIRFAHMGGADTLLTMPNVDGLTMANSAYQYLLNNKEIVKDLEVPMQFIGTMMLTENTSAEELEEVVRLGIRDVKIYPRYRTTNSEDGVVFYEKVFGLVSICARLGIRVHLHPEHPWKLFTNRDAEYLFLPIAEMLLRTGATIIWEHGTDARCILFWKEMAKTGRFFVTLTAHHLATNEDDTFGDVRSVCKPPIKTLSDKEGLINLVAQGFDWVMAGADDAPHDRKKKHVKSGKCNCGAYTAPFLLPLYLHALEDVLKLPDGDGLFIKFSSFNARRLYDLGDEYQGIQVWRHPFKIPDFYKLGSWEVEPFWAGQEIGWNLSRP